MDKKALEQAIKACTIADVYLRSTSVQLDDDFDPTAPGQKLDVEYRIQAKQREEITGDSGNLLKVYVEAGLRHILAQHDQEDREARIVAEVSALFVAVYRITGDKPQEDCLNEFAKINAPYHIWPYWREYAQSLCMRHRLPAVMLPMLTVSQLEGNSAENG